MKKFSEFLTEAVKNKEISFYSLYTTPFPSKETKDLPVGEEKDEALATEENNYKSILTNFLQKTSSMN